MTCSSDVWLVTSGLYHNYTILGPTSLLKINCYPLTKVRLGSVSFSTPIDLGSKIHTRFQAWRRQKLCYHFLERQQKGFLKSISNSHIILSFLFIWNWNDKYVHALPNSLENHTRIQTKIGKVYARFQSKTAQKPYPWGRYIPVRQMYVCTAPPPPGGISLDEITWEDRKLTANGPH